MERLILEAYDNAKSNEFFVITTMLERLVNRRYSLCDPRGDITTGQVRQILDRRGMDYTLAKNSKNQKSVTNTGHSIYRKRTKRMATAMK
ncbi:hypothetical protein EV210_10670 [Anaerospora hongkongensis]|uniref:Uncharacterized protein n=1 Tax=Anaerospora hongkongensis TaxID=244830 RepID=A0A4R1Q5X9_9FIRM|nr:hypothetical protein [Anaerospora hongkongensis]TCL37204.1 hypothetical protein EV210_10670 [Anaerospora hongkongensis]